MLAGLWEDWTDQTEHLRSFAILTTEANEQTRPLHDRMPVILRPDAWSRWLDVGAQGGKGLEDLLAPYRGDLLVSKIRLTKPNALL